VYEDFAKLDIRVGKVLLAKPVKMSNKLMRVEMDLGEKKPRRLVAGVASYYVPEELVGTYVLCSPILNLPNSAKSNQTV
jgi:methionyl-tRNA synthetase